MRLTILDMEKMKTTVEGHGCRLGGMDAGWICTANIFEVIFTVFNCVQISTVISLYGLHFTAAPSTV